MLLSAPHPLSHISTLLKCVAISFISTSIMPSSPQFFSKLLSYYFMVVNLTIFCLRSSSTKSFTSIKINFKHNFSFFENLLSTEHIPLIKTRVNTKRTFVESKIRKRSAKFSVVFSSDVSSQRIMPKISPISLLYFPVLTSVKYNLINNEIIRWHTILIQNVAQCLCHLGVFVNSEHLNKNFNSSVPSEGILVVSCEKFSVMFC